MPGGTGIVARPGEVVGVAECGKVLAQAEQAAGRSGSREGLAQAHGAEPGRRDTQDLIEGEESRAGREGSPALLPAVPNPSR